MRIRRVVTAKDRGGKSIVVSDGFSPSEKVMQRTPGFVSSPIWKTQAAPDLAKGHADPMRRGDSVLAPVGGAVFIVVTFPPDSVMASPSFDPVAAGAEQLEGAPGLAETFEIEHPGMHTTPTLDFATVVKGEITLELDDGKTIKLKQGDTIVQHGVRHAWRNPGAEPATVSFVMLGAKNAGGRGGGLFSGGRR